MPTEREIEQLIDSAIAAQSTRLALTGFELTELPDRVGRLTGLTELDLTSNRLTSLPGWLAEMAGLQSIRLDGNNLESVPDWIGELSRLRVLDLSNNPIRTLPRTLTNLIELRDLRVDGEYLDSLPDWFAELDGLTRLHLSYTDLTRHQAVISHLVGLRHLHASNARSIGSAELLGRLANLEVLELAGAHHNEVPAWVRELHKLTVLDLSLNNLHSLPSWFGELTRLTDLNLSQNDLSALPPSMQGLTSLKDLQLSFNQRLRPPAWLGRLGRLTSLHVAGNGLDRLPESVRRLTGLTALNVGFNDIEELPAWLSELGRLRVLLLGSNPLKTIPEVLRSFSSLTYLDVEFADIHAVPDWMGELRGLGTLALGGNPLARVPESLSRLTGLSTLRMGHCALRALPDWLDQMSALAYLDVSNNDLTQLPAALGQMTALRTLSVDGNPLVSPPPEIVASGVGAIVEYLRAEREDGKTRLWRSKLVLVGQGRAGKSTLVAALDGRGFDKDRPSTQGLAITSLVLPHPDPRQDPARESVAMDLTVWDFGGQEIYHATHQFFLTARSLFLVVWDPNQGYDNSRLRYWLDTVTARAPEAPIILVATHGEQRPADLPLTDLKERFPMIVNSVVVDSATQQGIAELRTLITKYAAGLPLMGASWPTPWAAGADALRSLSKAETHTPIANVRALLELHGVQNAAQDEVIAALAFLGDILHYSDEPRLRETVVLQPEWLNTRIARILDSKAVASRGGRLLWTDVDAEWSDIDAELRDHFLTMMDRFDVSYRVFDQGAQVASIVTALLPWERPPLTDQWPARYSGRQVTVTYTLSFIPPGIPTWFITRTNRFAIRHWRTGALLRDEESESLALIEADVTTGTLTLTARGEALDRFLPLLLSELARSLRRYPGLSAKRLIRCPLPDDDEHPPHDYPYLQLLKVLLRGSDSVDCLETGATIRVRRLLEGIEPTVAELAELGGDVMADRLEAVLGRRLEQIENHILATKTNTDVLRMAAAEAVAVHCPSVFVVRRIRSGVLRTRYELQVCCEHEGGWHVIPANSPDAQDAVYDLRALHEWARELAPRVQTVAATAKAALPLIAFLLGGIAIPLHGDAKKELLAARAHLPKIPGHVTALDGPAPPSDFPLSAHPVSYAATDADFRELSALFAALDAADARGNRRALGGLSAAQDSTGRTLFVCREHSPRR